MSSFPAKLMAAIVAVLLLVCDFSATSASVPYGNYNFSSLSHLVWFGISSCNARQQLLHLSYLVQLSHFSPNQFYSIWSYPVHFVPIQSIGSIRSILVPFGPPLSNLVYSVLYGPHWSYVIYSFHFCPIQSLWSNLVHFGLIGPFCLLWSYLVHFGHIRSCSVHSVHFGQILSIWSYLASCDKICVSLFGLSIFQYVSWIVLACNVNLSHQPYF